MFFWYLGAGTALLVVTLGPRRLDFRLALLGLLLPLADIPLRLVLYPHGPAGVHLYLHTFAFPVLLALAIMTFLRGARARMWFVVPMGVVIHLLLAGMLGDPVGAFWPLLGTHFTHLPAGVSVWSQVVPIRGWDFVREGLGLAALLYAAAAFQLHQPDARRRFWRTGTLATRRVPGGPGVEWPRSRPGDRGPVANGHRAEEGPGSAGQDAG